MFLTGDITAQPGTFALVPQVVDAVRVPVVAAGGIADGRGIAAAFMLGAAGAQIGTAYLFSPEPRSRRRSASVWRRASDDGTKITNLMTGRPARGLVNRVMAELGPPARLRPFRMRRPPSGRCGAAAEKAGSADFSPIWSGQAAALGAALRRPN